MSLPRGADAELLGQPVDKLYYCFGCGASGDLITFVRESEQLDFAGAIEWLAERFGVPLEYEETSPAQDAERRRRERLLAAARPGRRVLRALPLGLARRARARLPRRPRARRGGLPRFRLGLALGGETLAAKAREKGFTPTSCARPGS